jgi:hypothetical protein
MRRLDCLSPSAVVIGSPQSCLPEGSKNSMPKVRGSVAGTEIPSEKPSRWHERFGGHFE